MDSSKNFQNIKAEKAKAMEKYRKMQKVSGFFKLMEVFIFLIVLSRFTTMFPSSFKLSGEYAKDFFLSLLISPKFVFVVGNLIVFTLFWISGQLSNQDYDNNNNGKLDLYDEYVKSCQRNPKREIFTQKQSIKKRRKEKTASADNYCMTEKKMQRSQSERLRNTHESTIKEDEICHGLKRSQTEKCLKTRSNEHVDVDEMSTEDFRLRVEAFIARQQRFLRGEDEGD